MPGRNPLSTTLTAAILFLFWVVLSGHLDWVHLGMGIVSSALIAYLFPVATLADENGGTRRLGADFPGLVRYFVRLQYEIVRANLDVIRIILDPALPISPVVRRYRGGPATPTALVAFGNSLTLTPGTLTLDIERGGDCYIHYLTAPDPAQEKTEELCNAVRQVFDRRAP